ncbi:DUF5132 domain-containing protein [Nocardia sp. BMG51109]|uniref:DUF5132 domain-containing protein n=1 Tax=Nocardia sp. BMG51109 TaxID=1056816 RepID=UPI0021012C9F|nr:DUF5132 domain-containing protein [Nocardia sp. BMG51109]
MVAAPLATKIVKPVIRGAVKTTVGLAIEAKRAAAEVSEDLQDIVAEAAAEATFTEPAAESPEGDRTREVKPSSKARNTTR